MNDWSTLLIGFAAAFTTPSFEIFLRLSAAWVLCPGGRRITRLVPLAEPLGEKAHDAYHRFFRDGAWRMSELWRLIARIMVTQFQPSGRIPLQIDDTLFHKTGRKVEGAGWWRDAVRSSATKVVHGFGLNIVLMTLAVNPPWGGEPLALPVNARLHRKNDRSLLDLAHDMLRELAAWFPDREFDICADGFYAPMASMLPADMYLTSRIRRDAALYDLPPQRLRATAGRPRKKGKRLPTPEQMAQTKKGWKRLAVNMRGKLKQRLVLSRPVLWYAVCPTQPVLLVISRAPDGIEEDDFLFTTDLHADPAQVIARYAARWAIEDTFKNVKQSLGGQEPQLWKRAGPERAAAFAFWLYAIIWLAYLKTNSRSPTFCVLPWYPKKKRPSFVDALSNLRGVLWRQRLFMKSEKKPLPSKIIRHLIMVLAFAA